MNLKTLSSFLFTLFIFLILPFQVSAVPSTNLWLDNPNSSTINLNINTNKNQAIAAQIHLKYNPQFVFVNSLSAGSFFSNPNIMDYKIDNEQGNASIILLASPTEPVSGQGNLVKLSYTALKDGTTTISISSNTKIAAINESTNVVVNSKNLDLNISSVTKTTQVQPSKAPTPILRQQLTPTKASNTNQKTSPTNNQSESEGQEDIQQKVQQIGVSIALFYTVLTVAIISTLSLIILILRRRTDSL